MSISLVKGQKIDLTKGNGGLVNVAFGLGWDTNKYDGDSDFDLDVSVFLTDASGKVSMDINLYKTYVEGYLSTAGKSLTKAEIDNLPFSAKLLTLECGIRFLTDYLDGDVYFGTAYPEHNLDRCHTQFKLVYDMEQKMDEMMRITQEVYNSL